MQFFKHTDLSDSEDKLGREPSQEISLEAGTIIDMNIDEIPAFSGEKLRWREVLKRILDVILFIGERRLAFQGDTEKIGDVHNGNN